MYLTPSVKLLDKFGFHPMGIAGYYRSEIDDGKSLVLVFIQGKISIYVEDDEELESDKEDFPFKVRDLNLETDRQLEVILRVARR
jgi:hypothetical protein